MKKHISIEADYPQPLTARLLKMRSSPVLARLATPKLLKATTPGMMILVEHSKQLLRIST
jgi:hypothetical protein